MSKKENNMNDIRKLNDFSAKLKERLDYFVKSEPESFYIFHMEKDVSILNLIRDAWKKTRPRFQIMTNYLNEYQPIEKLEKAGLTGSELKLKLFLVSESYNGLLNYERKNEKRDYPGTRGSLGQRIRRRIEHWMKYFDHANTILGSLSSLGIPGAEAISEFKYAIEKFLKWWRKA